MLDTVGFIGSGMMASALMDGLMAKKALPSPASITCSDIWKPSLDIAASKGYNVSSTNDLVCKNSKTAVILAVKPHIIVDVCQDVINSNNDALVISIAAGVTLATLQKNLPNRRVVRVMPNTPCLVGEAASGFALGSLANDSDRDIVQTIFGSVGLAMEVKENLLDAVTGVSGSGPAYVFQFIEALSDGGVRCGLPRDVSTKLAAQMVKGAAEMVLVTGKHPGVLKDGVTSPGGTTIAGVEALEKGGFRATTIAAVCAVTRRSLQLGGASKEEIETKYNL